MRDIKSIGSKKNKMVVVMAETLKICREGGYNKNGLWVEIGKMVEDSVGGTELYSGDEMGVEFNEVVRWIGVGGCWWR